MLKQTQSQRLVQKVLPQIIQKQSLLAIPTIALEQMVRLELEQNPFLEETDIDLNQTEEETEKAENDDYESESDARKEEASKEDEYNWDDYMNTENEGYKAPSGSEENEINYENLWKTPLSKNDYLLSQLYLLSLEEKHVTIGEAIISSLDGDGYFRVNTDDFINDVIKQFENAEQSGISITSEEVEEVLKEIQKFDPPGIAARNLQECLIIQLDAKPIDSNLKSGAINIIQNHFEEFRLKNYEKLASELNINIEYLNVILDEILKLNPKPSSAIEDSSMADYIHPDLIVTKENDEYKVELNDRNMPSLKINSAYRKLITEKEKNLDKNTKDFIFNNFERAKWFLQAINSRRETMLKVMNSILKYQRDFFDKLGEGLKPLYEKDVAEDISMDISTVSRTVRGKYVQSDFGIYELRSFFSHSMKNDEGQDISNIEIKNKLKEIIDAEDAQKPLTDEQLVLEMQKHGFKLARRTVAKYREMLKIPKARLRRKLQN